MLKIKKGVQPPIVHIIAIVANVAEKRDITLTITSCIDGKHSDWSGHYQLRCLDVRSKNLSNADKARVLIDIRAAMRQYFPSARIYARIHDEGKRNEHIHVQFK